MVVPFYLKMRRISSFRLYRNFYLPEKPRLLAHSVSTAAVYRREHLNETSGLKLGGDIYKGEKRYEDTFGNLDSFERKFMKIKQDPEDVKDYRRDKAAQGKKISQYIKEVAEHLRNKDYKSALRVLEVDMYNDRKPPVAWIYTDLIMYNARIGNLEEAYRLYTNFKKFGGKLSGAMYTAVFAACQTCKNTDFALKATTLVKEYLMNDKNTKPNATHFRAIILAYGKHGDLQSCFKVFDELMYKRDKISVEEYHAMFQAILNDQNAGLRHALLFWRKMLQYRIKPTKEVFHDLLDCVRYCSLGDTKLLPDLLKEIDEQSKVFVRKKVKIETVNNEKRRTVLKIPADGKAWYLSLKPADLEKNLEILNRNSKINEELKGMENTYTVCEDTLNHSLELQKNSFEEIPKAEYENKSEEELPVSFASKKEDQKFESALVQSNITLEKPELPNLIAFEPTLGCVVDFKALTTPQHRFVLLGGLRGFLKVMFEFGVIPTSKTLTQLLFVVPEDKESHLEILNIAKALNIKLDTEFFNALMKVRIFLGEDFECAQKYLKMMQEHNLRPDLITFGTLALACVNLKYASQLVQSVHNFGFRLNTQILGALLNKAVFAGDLDYVKGILDWVKEYEVHVDGKFIAKLVNFVEKHKHLKMTNGFEKKLCTYSTS